MRIFNAIWQQQAPWLSRARFRRSSTVRKLLSADRIEDGSASARSRDAYASVFQVTQCDIHHCRHQCVVEGVVLDEKRDAEIFEDRGERQIDGRVWWRIAILAFVVKFGD